MPTKTITKPSVKTGVKSKSKFMLAPGHNACAGCGQMIAARAVVETLGPNIIVANATGCLEVTTTAYPTSAWGMPWIHSVFENASAIASGIIAGLKQKGLDKKYKVLAQGGDGGSFDIGFGLISGMWERGENIMYVAYDNEAYANTGRQASSATPWGAATTTTPAGSGKTIDAIGSHQKKKDMIAIALAHGLNYVAQTTAGHVDDIKRKIKKASETPGPSYLQILVPCVPGWIYEPSKSVKIGKMAAQTGLYPLLEYENGKLTNILKVPRPRATVDEYLKMQGRFAHLFKTEKGRQQIKYIQSLADANIEEYGL